MADQFALWIRKRLTAQDFGALKDALSAAGYTLIHPAYDSGIVLDDDGEQIQVPESEIADTVTAGKRLVTFEWWLTSDEDIVCSAAPVPSDDRLQELWFYLDGVDQEVRERVAEALVGLVRSAPADTTGLVVDYRGRTIEFDWRRYLLDGGLGPAVPPDVLIVNRRPEEGRSNDSCA